MRRALTALVMIFGLRATSATGQVKGAAPTITYHAPAASSDRAFTTPVVRSVDDGCEINHASGLVIQSNGQIVVANVGNHELCLFDSAGKFVRKIGRLGSGPGEFQFLTALRVYRGDSLITTDVGLRRLSFFGPDGTHARDLPIAAPDTGLGSNTLLLGLSDGSLLLGFSEVRRAAPRPDAVVFGQRIFRVDPTGDHPAALGPFFDSEHFIQHVPKELGGTAYWSLAFGRSVSIAPARDGFVAGDGSDFDIREYARTGAVRRIHRLDLKRRAVTPADIATYRDAQLKDLPADRRALTEKMLAEMPYPAEFPSYVRLLTDDLGGIWLQPIVANDDAPRWLRLDPSNGSVSGFRFPARFTLHAVRGRRACGLQRDELDVQTVVCFQE